MATTSKEELIHRIAADTETKQVLVKTVVEQFFHEVIAGLAKNTRLEFRDFGVFDTKTTPVRTAQNLKTLEKVDVSAKRRVVFRMGNVNKNGLDTDAADAAAHVERQT